MLIGELAKRTGLSRDTIRFYEKERLIGVERPGRKPMPTNTYKNYPESAVSTLQFVLRTKALGFTLAEIRALLAIREREPSGSRKWMADAREKIGEIDRKMAELRRLKSLISEALARCNDRCLDEGCGVLDSPAAGKVVAGRDPMPEGGGCTG